MNCLEFRRYCVAEPAAEEREFVRHKNECTACAKFAARMRQVDKTIVEAVHVDVPQDLPSRIILRQSLQEDQAPRKNVSRKYAIAASLMLTLGLAGSFYTLISTAPFHRAVMAHLDGEWESLVEAQDLSDGKLRNVLDTVGAEFKGEVGDIKYASLCDFSEYGGAHLVLEGHKGPVVVLLLPEKHIAGPQVVSGDQGNGVIVPTNNGSMAIVGHKEEPLHNIERRLRTGFVWRL